MIKVAKVLGAIFVPILALVLGGLIWANVTTSSKLARHYETHHVDFPIPYPLTAEEISQLRAEKIAAQKPVPSPSQTDISTDVPPAPVPPPDPLAGIDLKALAHDRAVARGKHLVESRYACIACHASDFGGGTMVDAPPIGHLFGMNLTRGQGGVIAGYTPSDWDRIVRHGVKRDGKAALMPSEDFFRMSDHELSDIATYVLSVPAVDREKPRPTLGPVGVVLVATGRLPLSAERKTDHQSGHAVDPPPSGETLEFGKHLVSVCMGCHRQTLEGGPIPGGDPAWPPAMNLTPAGLAGWTYADFTTAVREGKRKNGAALRKPMADMMSFGKQCTETELKAMWLYLQSVPAKPTAG